MPPVVRQRRVPGWSAYEPYVLRCSTSATGGSRHFFRRHQPAARPWSCDTSRDTDFRLTRLQLAERRPC
jgi:hypothetical protein